jgi:hypothetical protein
MSAIMENLYQWKHDFLEDPSSILICGDRGAGKSSFINDFLARCAQRISGRYETDKPTQTESISKSADDDDESLLSKIIFLEEKPQQKFEFSSYLLEEGSKADFDPHPIEIRHSTKIKLSIEFDSPKQVLTHLEILSKAAKDP